MENLPVYISAVFVFTTFLTVWFFYKAARQSKRVLLIISGFLVLQMLVALTGFFTVTYTVPPRFLALVGPPMLLIISLFATRRGRKFIDTLEPEFLTLLQAVRIPVELVLFWLFLYKSVPELMTFEGRNFDILSGLTAPVIYYFGFVKKQLSPKMMLFWNFICLGLLFNVISIAVLSSPTTFQQFAFDQPNIAVLYFPFVWLPGCIVPLVLLSHLASVRQLLAVKTNSMPAIS